MTHPRFAQQYRLNVGTIIEAPSLNVRLARQRGKGGNVAWGAGARQGGGVFRRVAQSRRDLLLLRHACCASRVFARTNASSRTPKDSTPKIPSYAGGKFPLSTYLAEQVRAMLADPARWGACLIRCSDWLRIQKEKSVLPQPGSLLVETFPRGERSYMVDLSVRGQAGAPDAGHAADPAAGARQGAAARLHRHRLCRSPSGACATWARMFKNGELPLSELFDEDMLGDDLETWLAESFHAEAHLPQLRAHLRPG